jgi:glyoxylase-like metal-dependent hydrolase (beta-lactamase superfamily II)
VTLSHLERDATERLNTGSISRRAVLGGFAAAGLSGALRVAPAKAQAATPAAGLPATHRVSVGQIEVVVLYDGAFAGPANLFATNAPPAALADAMEGIGLAPTDPLSLTVQPLLVETDGQRVLLDTGSGVFNDPAGTLLGALAAEGIAPEEIDVVLMTHLHGDHYGGAIGADGGLTFPNARHLISAVEYDFWAAEPSLDELVLPDEFKPLFRQGAKDALTALSGALEQIAPGDEIAPGLTAVDARGHTPGQLAVEISSDGEGALHIVDAAHVPAIHLEHPDWFMMADNWPAWTAATRQALFDRAADENLLVFTYHFPFPGVGRVTKDEIGWTWAAEP